MIVFVDVVKVMFTFSGQYILTSGGVLRLMFTCTEPWRFVWWQHAMWLFSSLDLCVDPDCLITLVRGCNQVGIHTKHARVRGRNHRISHRSGYEPKALPLRRHPGWQIGRPAWRPVERGTRLSQARGECLTSTAVDCRGSLRKRGHWKVHKSVASQFVTIRSSELDRGFTQVYSAPMKQSADFQSRLVTGNRVSRLSERSISVPQLVSRGWFLALLDHKNDVFVAIAAEQ